MKLQLVLADAPALLEFEPIRHFRMLVLYRDKMSTEQTWETVLKNILIVSTSLQTQGGITSVVRLLLESELVKKYQLYHLATHRNGSFVIKLYYLVRSYLLFPLYLSTKKISIIHIHGGMKSSFLRKAYFLFLGKILRKKVIFHMHSAMVDEYFSNSSKLKSTVIKWLMNKYDVIIVIGEYWEKVLRRYTTAPIEVIYNPVKPMRSRDTNEKVWSPMIVLTLGEIGERKGTKDLIHTAALLKDKDIIFCVAGNGDFTIYRSLIRELLIEDKVKYLGWIGEEERARWLKRANVYFLPSYFEGLPMSLLEAANYKLPLVSTKVGAIPEIIENGKNGFLIDPGAVDSYAKKLAFLYSKPDIGRKMGEASEDVIREKFCVSNVSCKVDALYQNLLRKSNA